MVLRWLLELLKWDTRLIDIDWSHKYSSSIPFIGRWSHWSSKKTHRIERANKIIIFCLLNGFQTLQLEISLQFLLINLLDSQYVAQLSRWNRSRRNVRINIGLVLSKTNEPKKQVPTCFSLAFLNLYKIVEGDDLATIKYGTTPKMSSKFNLLTNLCWTIHLRNALQN